MLLIEDTKMYFNSIPDFLYPDFQNPGKYKLSKNIFRRVRPRDSFNAVYASTITYTVRDGETPDTIAQKELGSFEWYWTILIINNIINYQEDWPVQSDELEKIIDSKYGDLTDKPRHWETSEVRNTMGDIVLEKGVIIEMFQNNIEQNTAGYWPKVRTPAGVTNWSFTYIDRFDTNGVIVEETVSAPQVLVKITNREYEYQLNELKRSIKLPKKSFLTTMEKDLMDLMKYDTQYKITDEGYRISENI
jgi:hypothetical protein